MPNQIIDGQPTDPRNVDHWLHLDDFSPGCYDGSYISTAEPIYSAPFGAANADFTFCCAATSNGALAPLPSPTPFGYSPGFPGALTKWFITGFIINPGLANVHDEAIIILEGDDGTTHYVLGYSYDVQGATANVILSSNSGSVPGIFGAPYPAWTRMNAGGSGNPPPELVFPGAVSTDASGNSGHLYVYPPIATPTVFAVQDLIVAMSSTTGQVIAYGDRILVLSGLEYPWPAGGGIGTNENINFTDPPQSSAYGNQQTILGSETPWGYGAWGSVSVGELMLIKKYGGGVALYGDIFSPSSVIELPGMQSTGDFVGKAASTEIGLIYCSENQGAWVWNGGNTSQKISAQLRDDFYDATTASGMQGNNYGFSVAHWQDWMLFSNNFLYNADTNSWWVLYPTTGNGNDAVTGQTFWWYSPGRFGYHMYAAPLDFGPGATWFVRFDNRVAAPNYQWQSLPMHVVPNATRLVDVLQVVLRVSDPSHSGASNVTVTIGGQSVTTIGTIQQDPTLFRLDFGSATLGLMDIGVTIESQNTGGNSAPIVHSIDIGYKTRALQRADN